MAITLYRFPISHFSEKGRALLDFKGLDYRIEELALGVPQLRLVRLSGQRKAPVIDHDGRIVFDSTEIALYLERTFPDRPRLLPDDPTRRAEVLALEDRLDRALGLGPTLAWIEWEATQPEIVELLKLEVHGLGAAGARAVAAAIRAGARGPAKRVFDEQKARARAMLLELCERLARSKYLVGDAPTLADIAAVGLPLHLEFPRSRYFALPALAGRGVPGWADDPALARFFEWRRRFYADFLK